MTETARRRAIRATAILCGVLAPLAVLFAARLAGVEVLTVRGDGVPAPLDAFDVVAVSLVAGVLAWGSLALLERFLPRWATVGWTTAAAVALVVVLVQTATDASLDGAQRWVLGFRAVAMVAALVPLLAWTSARREIRR